MVSATLSTLFCLLIFIVLIGFILLASSFRKVPENEQWVVTRLGDTFVKSPGWMMQVPLVDHVIRVDMGETPTNIQDQICIISSRAPLSKWSACARSTRSCPTGRSSARPSATS